MVSNKGAYKKKWYHSNRQRVYATLSRWKRNNPDKVRKYNRISYARHREEIIEQRRKYKEENIEAYKLRMKIKRNARRTLTKSLTIKTIQQVYEENILKFGTLTCELCIKPVEFGEDTLEHFHPISRKEEYVGDINERKNLGVAHGINSVEKCNTKKGNKTLSEYNGL